MSYNPTASGLTTLQRTLTSMNIPLPAGINSELYTNIPLRPSELNFKGGDGAVIITW